MLSENLSMGTRFSYVTQDQLAEAFNKAVFSQGFSMMWKALIVAGFALALGAWCSQMGISEWLASRVFRAEAVKHDEGHQDNKEKDSPP